MGRSRGHRAIGVLTAVAAGVGIWLISTDEIPGPPPPSDEQGVLATQRRLLGELRDEGQHTPGPRGTARPAAMAPARPERIRIPSLRVDAPLAEVGQAGDGGPPDPGPGDGPPRTPGSHDSSPRVPASGGGAPHAPNDPDLAAWYADGPPPGAQGTAVIVGPVGDRQDPGVFHRLGTLVKGRLIEVVREDGTTAVFSVDTVEDHGGRRSSEQRGHGTAGRPELRVVGCDGTCAEGAGGPAGVVVHAHLTGVVTGAPPGAR
ncbi:sortase domain-containing protein [Streptomyces sp. NPDC054956]